MKLVRKLTFALILGILPLMVANGYFRVRREVTWLESDMAHDQQAMGRALRSAVEWVAHGQDGLQRARSLVADANQREAGVDISMVELGAIDGTPLPADLEGQVRHGTTITVEKRNGRGELRRVTYVPLTLEGVPASAIELSETLARVRTFVLASLTQVVIVTLAILAVCGIIAMLLGVWFVGEPIRRLCEKARRVGTGDFGGRLELRQRDELGELGDELNAMCDRLDQAQRRVAAETAAKAAMADQLRHADRLKTIGQLASGLAHELGTPLNVVMGRAQMLRTGGLPPAEATRSAQVIVEQSARMTTIIRELLDFSRRRGPTPTTVMLPEIARRTLDMLRPFAGGSGATLELEVDHGVPAVDVDTGQMQQAVANLVLNGIQAMPSGGRLTIRIGRRDARPPADHGGAAGEWVCLAVEDEGRGIPADSLPHIFEPFFTTKDVGEGTGLGLSVVYGIVSEHGGWIEVVSTVGRGSRFAIFLPPAAAAEAERVAM